jgi:aspartate racemase
MQLTIIRKFMFLRNFTHHSISSSRKLMPIFKTIGIIPVTAPGGALCYQTIVNRSIALYGGHHHPNICMHHHNFENYHHAQVEGRWDKVGDMLLDSAEKVFKAGADFAIIPANTIHRPEILKQLKQSPIPILSMLDVVALHCHENRFQKIAILGTRWTMRDNIYKDALGKLGIQSITPLEKEQEVLQNAIIDDLIPGKHTDKTVTNLLRVTDAINSREGNNQNFALALACTELPIVLNKMNCKVPVIDTTAVLAHAALDHAADKLNLDISIESDRIRHST